MNFNRPNRNTEHNYLRKSNKNTVMRPILTTLFKFLFGGYWKTHKFECFEGLY